MDTPTARSFLTTPTTAPPTSSPCCKETDNECECSDDGGVTTDEEGGANDILDVEDIGGVIKKRQDKQKGGVANREMVTPLIRQSLTKQGQLTDFNYLFIDHTHY